jgi:hypothetical protein
MIKWVGLTAIVDKEAVGCVMNVSNTSSASFWGYSFKHKNAEFYDSGFGSEDEAREAFKAAFMAVTHAPVK